MIERLRCFVCAACQSDLQTPQAVQSRRLLSGFAKFRRKPSQQPVAFLLYYGFYQANYCDSLGEIENGRFIYPLSRMQIVDLMFNESLRIEFPEYTLPLPAHCVYTGDVIPDKYLTVLDDDAIYDAMVKRAQAVPSGKIDPEQNLYCREDPPFFVPSGDELAMDGIFT